LADETIQPKQKAREKCGRLPRKSRANVQLALGCTHFHNLLVVFRALLQAVERVNQLFSLLGVHSVVFNII
jgi:hypothetical protein